MDLLFIIFNASNKTKLLWNERFNYLCKFLEYNN